MKFLNGKYNELEKLINLAIEYYNKKYNYFTDSEIFNLISFIRKQNEIKVFNFNLLHNALYNNKMYIDFVQKYNLMSFDDYLSLYDNFFKELQNIIKVPRIINITNVDKYQRKNLNISNDILDNKNILNIKIISYTYITYYFEKDFDYTINKVIKILEEQLNDIQNGYCDLLEKIMFIPQTIYGETDDYAKDYVYMFTDLNDINSIEYNYKLHLELLKSLKEICYNK